MRLVAVNLIRSRERLVSIAIRLSTVSLAKHRGPGVQDKILARPKSKSGGSAGFLGSRGGSSEHGSENAVNIFLSIRQKVQPSR